MQHNIFNSTVLQYVLVADPLLRYYSLPGCMIC